MNRARLSTPTSTPQAGRSRRSTAASRSRVPRDPWLEMVAAGYIASPLAGEPGHGGTAVLRRQPVQVVDGRERGQTDSFELICCECGDNPYLDYSQVSLRLQQVRGPYPIATGLAAYERHLGLAASDSPA